MPRSIGVTNCAMYPIPVAISRMTGSAFRSPSPPFSKPDGDEGIQREISGDRNGVSASFLPLDGSRIPCRGCAVTEETGDIDCVRGGPGRQMDGTGERGISPGRLRRSHGEL